jgi:hypothetical protein
LSTICPADYKSNLASFGAAIVLLSIPLDGFFQRLISFPSVEVFDRSNATISRAIIYDPDPKLSWLNGTSKFGPDAQLDAYANPFWLNGIASLISPGVVGRSKLQVLSTATPFSLRITSNIPRFCCGGSRSLRRLDQTNASKLAWWREHNWQLLMRVAKFRNCNARPAIALTILFSR